MFSKMLCSMIFFIFSGSAIANDIMHPLLQIPNEKDYLMILRNGQNVDVFLVNPYEKTISDSGSVNMSLNEKIISVFYNNKNVSNVYVLSKEKSDNRGLSGFYYNTYVYDISNGKISINRTEILPLENCFDGIDMDTGEKEVCEYKDAASVLRFLKNGK